MSLSVLDHPVLLRYSCTAIVVVRMISQATSAHAWHVSRASGLSRQPRDEYARSEPKCAGEQEVSG